MAAINEDKALELVRIKNEEKALELALYYEVRYSDTKDLLWTDLKDIAMEMAKFKDEQFSIERKQLIEKRKQLIEKANQAVTQSFENGANFMKQEMIKKACKWLISGGYFVNSTETIEDFKKYMEE